MEAAPWRSGGSVGGRTLVGARAVRPGLAARLSMRIIRSVRKLPRGGGDDGKGYRGWLRGGVGLCSVDGGEGEGDA